MPDDRVPTERERAFTAIALGAVLGLVLVLFGRRSRAAERISRRRTG